MTKQAISSRNNFETSNANKKIISTYENQRVHSLRIKTNKILNIATMKKLLFYLVISSFVLFICACQSIKTIKLLKGGDVVQKTFTTTIPFEMRMGLIILKVKVNGETVDFVLDTGAPNVISKELANKLNLGNKSTKKVADSQSAKNNLGFTIIPKIELGGVEFINTGAAIADIKASQEVSCLNIQGFIGANLMKKAIWKFDFVNNTITISNTKTEMEIPSTAIIIPFKTEITGTPKADISYNGVVEKDVTIDFGYNGSYMASDKTWKELIKKEPSTTSNFGVGSIGSGLFGTGKSDTTYFGLIKSLSCSGLTLENQVVSFNKASAKTMGMIFFKKYTVIFDWFTNSMTLIENRNERESELKNFGLKPGFKEDKLVVRFVYQKSSASKAGILLGDQILQVGDKDYRNVSHSDWCEILTNGFFPKDIEKIDITFKRGGDEQKAWLYKSSLFE